MNLVIEDTLVVITSALFVSAEGKKLTEPSTDRMDRVEKSLIAFEAKGFNHFVLLDNTVPPGYSEAICLPIKFATLTPTTISLPANEFQLNGPSRLEAVLLAQTAEHIRQSFKDFKFILKISAGYELKNTRKVLAKAGAGAVFRMGNPLRLKIKFCLTSFYILPMDHYLDLVTYFNKNLDEMTNLKPLEYYLYRYVQKAEHELVAMPYPQLDARFISSRRSSEDWNYRLKELVFRFLSRLGLYAYVLK